MRGLASSIALALTLTVSFPLLHVASGRPPDPWEGPSSKFSRQILQKSNTTSTDLRPARVTGTLALYSLFGLFVISSITTCIIGTVVTLQWPNPRICCYRTPHSDVPNSESCGCCALHRLNIGFAVTWLALLILLVLALIIYLMAAAAVLAVVHAALAYRLIRQLKMNSPIIANQVQMLTAVVGGPPQQGVVTGVAMDWPLPGVPVPGIPVMNVPMTVAVVDGQLQTHINFASGTGARSAANGEACGTSSSRSNDGIHSTSKATSKLETAVDATTEGDSGPAVGVSEISRRERQDAGMS